MPAQSPFTRTATPGEMDQPISFLTVDQTVDDAGGVVSSTTRLSTSRDIYAKVKRRTGTETSEADTPTARTHATIETRFVDGINKNMRVSWQDVEWEIVDLDPVPREDRLYISVSRRGSSGDGGGR